MRIFSARWSEDCEERRQVVYLNGRGFRRRRRPNPEGPSSQVAMWRFRPTPGAPRARTIPGCGLDPRPEATRKGGAGKHPDIERLLNEENQRYA